MKTAMFHLKKLWQDDNGTVNLYEEIKAGRKTSEWRKVNRYWVNRLLKLGGMSKKKGSITVSNSDNGEATLDLSCCLTVDKAWFVTGYPKGNLPRLEADVTGLIYHVDSELLEIKFNNVREMT